MFSKLTSVELLVLGVRFLIFHLYKPTRSNNNNNNNTNNALLSVYPLKYDSSPVKCYLVTFKKYIFMTMKCKNKKLMDSKEKCIYSL